MALSIAYQNAAGGPAALRNLGCIPIIISTGGATYATASGGLVVDLTSILANASLNGIPYADVIGVYAGLSTDGYTCPFTLVAITTNTMRMYLSAGTEIADGAVTKTINALILVRGGYMG